MIQLTVEVAKCYICEHIGVHVATPPIKQILTLGRVAGFIIIVQLPSDSYLKIKIRINIFWLFNTTKHIDHIQGALLIENWSFAFCQA